MRTTAITTITPKRRRLYNSNSNNNNETYQKHVIHNFGDPPPLHKKKKLQVITLFFLQCTIKYEHKNPNLLQYFKILLSLFSTTYIDVIFTSKLLVFRTCLCRNKTLKELYCVVFSNYIDPLCRS